MGSSHDMVLTKHHKAIRAAVYARDGYSCKHCGAKPESVPEDYDGHYTLTTTRRAKSGFPVYLVLDHIISRRNGGANSEDNLQTLCESCNAKKAAQDKRAGKVAA